MTQGVAQVQIAEDEYRVHIVAKLTKEYGKESALKALPMIEELFALQHGEGPFGKRILVLGATVEIEMARDDVAQVTLPVTVMLKGEQLDALLAELGLRG